MARRGSITFTNLEAEPLTTIWLRLWSNGVKGCGAHAITVAGFEGGTPGELSRRCTALPVDLDAPLEQGAEATVSMDVTIDLPARNDRFGHHGGLALVGTALPTLAIHDDLGWHLDPYVDLGESFYSIVGDYQVTLNVPAALRTPTTGTAVASRDQRPPADHDLRRPRRPRLRVGGGAAGDGSRTFGRHRSRRLVPAGRPDPRKPPGPRSNDRSCRSTPTPPASARSRIPEMDVVLTQLPAFGGMEYPTIIFTNPDKITISHELGHQYWYGIVGDDQFSSPWLDESFATWTSYLPFGGWKKCGDYRFPSADARITNDMGYWLDASVRVRHHLRRRRLHARQPDGPVRLGPVRPDPARLRAGSLARRDAGPSDFKAAIEAAAIADGLTFDAADLLGPLAGGLNDRRPG